MTTTPTPSDPELNRPYKGLLGSRFWMSIAFVLLFIAAGVGISVVGPKLLPRSRILNAPVDSNPVARLIESSAAPDPVVAPMAALDSDQAQAADLARQSLTASKLLQSGQTTRPFRAEWARLDAISPGNPDVAALRDLAGVGAPNAAMLAREFPSYATKAVAAAHAPGPDADIWTRMRVTLSKIVSVRRVDNLTGNGLDALLARAEVELGDGDIEAALHVLEPLEAKPRAALEPWQARARARTEIDRRVAALQDHALLKVSQLTGTRQ
jgi:hypothetical protein